ncbi:MAG TPA: thiamine pyrophosphate-binding protein, partial [Bacteroidetes bacterium]|nr:thiamine pyrophosphate-binding protein [Bacteroidota bacterium]
MLSTALIAKLINDTEQCLYTYPGGAIAPLLHECKRCGIDLIVSRAEQGAGYMAIAHASFTGRPSFVAVTSGPGATNLITCLADAYYDSIPLVAFTGQVGTRDLNRAPSLRQRGFQEAPVIAMVSPITKAVFQPKNPEQLAEMLNRAY